MRKVLSKVDLSPVDENFYSLLTRFEAHVSVSKRLHAEMMAYLAALSCELRGNRRRRRKKNNP
jgi:hypothetical protein